MAFSDRNAIVIGEEGVRQLSRSTVTVFGLGGVGATCAMDLVRAGIGKLVVMDFDIVQESNLNRLAFGFRQNIGKKKTEAFEEAARGINPEVEIQVLELFLSGESAARMPPPDSDFAIEAIDSLTPKVNLLAALSAGSTPFMASMGTAGRLKPELLKVASIWQTEGCPLAKNVRLRLRRLGVSADFQCVYSDEPPVQPVSREGTNPVGTSGRVRLTQGSMPFVPQTAGHILASYAVRSILGRAVHETENEITCSNIE